MSGTTVDVLSVLDVGHPPPPLLVVSPTAPPTLGYGEMAKAGKGEMALGGHDALRRCQLPVDPKREPQYNYNAVIAMTGDYEKASADFRRYLPLKLITLLWFFALFGVATYAIAATWSEWWPYTVLDIRNLDETKPAIYSFTAGTIGATIYAFRGFYWAVGPQNPENPKYQYDPNWTFWYISRPILGGFLGAFTYAILRAGVGTLGSPSSDDTAGAANFAIAFAAGFAATDVFNWLGATAVRLFDPKTQRPS